jgi:hypothetical protein
MVGAGVGDSEGNQGMPDQDRYPADGESVVVLGHFISWSPWRRGQCRRGHFGAAVAAGRLAPEVGVEWSVLGVALL